ncbi:MAG: Deoxyribose-phosphate aldolase [Candidatus Brocadiaceae bacterium]|nr:Deoxyribose-phosphate aldolase [Candidatus Brocadiaceae bacterium]
MKGSSNKTVYQDIYAVVEAAGQVPVKVIIEAWLPEDTENIADCLLTDRAKALFVNTSTILLLVRQW